MKQKEPEYFYQLVTRDGIKGPLTPLAGFRDEIKTALRENHPFCSAVMAFADNVDYPSFETRCYKWQTSRPAVIVEFVEE